MTITNPFDEIAGLKAKNQELRGLLRSENVTARALADAEDRVRNAEERRDTAESAKAEVENELSNQVVNLELALAAVAENLGSKTRPRPSKALQVAREALRKQAER